MQRFIFGGKDVLLLAQKTYCYILVYVLSLAKTIIKMQKHFFCLLFWFLVIINPGNVCLFVVICFKYKGDIEREHHAEAAYSMSVKYCMLHIYWYSAFPFGAPRDAEALPMGPCFFSSSHQTYTSPNYSVNTEWSYLLWVVLYAEGLLCFLVNCASFQERVKGFLIFVLEIP